MLHLLRHVRAFFDVNASEKGTSPTRWPAVERCACSPFVVVCRAHVTMRRTDVCISWA